MMFNILMNKKGASIIKMWATHLFAIICLVISLIILSFAVTYDTLVLKVIGGAFLICTFISYIAEQYMWRTSVMYATLKGR